MSHPVFSASSSCCSMTIFEFLVFAQVKDCFKPEIGLGAVLEGLDAFGLNKLSGGRVI